MKSLNFPARFIELATEINGHMPEHVADRVADLLNEDRLAVNGARILVLGVAYKAGVSDMRESPALDVIRLLAGKGAEVAYHDPHVREIAHRGHQLQERRPHRRRCSPGATSWSSSPTTPTSTTPASPPRRTASSTPATRCATSRRAARRSGSSSVPSRKSPGGGRFERMPLRSASVVLAAR